MSFNVPIRQTGGLPTLGSIIIPVEGNPDGDVNRSDPLTKLQIDKAIFGISEGTPVVANPGGTGLLALDTIGIDGVPYAVAGMGGAAGYSGARLGLTANRTAQDYSGFETLSWNHEVFDDGGYHDPAQPTRLTIPADVTRVVLHAGIALTALSLGADMTFDISKNSTSTGIGFTGNALAIDTIGRATITTGVLEVVEGDYFDVSVQVQGDTSVTLHQDGTFFSCHAATTSAGGGGGSDGVVEGLAFVESSGSITATLTRSGGLPDVVGNFDVFSGAYGDLTGLPTLFSGAYADLSGLPSLFTVVGVPTDQQVPVWSATNSQWEPGTVTGGGGTDTNDYVDAFTAALSGSDLTIDPRAHRRLGRLGADGDTASRWRGKHHHPPRPH